MPGPVFLRGDGVTLRPVEESDYEFLQRHANNPAVRSGFGGGAPTSADDVADRIEEVTESDDSETFLVCAAGGNDSESVQRVGEAFCFDLYERRGSVEIGYWIAPDHQGNGYATAAAELLVEYCFAERRLRKVDARVLAFNDGSRRVLEKVGFEPEGRRRDEYYVDGEYVDAELYGLVADDWDGPRDDASDADRGAESNGGDR
ncbi:GNAT family N-acetyltransferase [Halosimplex aquaticum]|uniref:GNAT family N-acetyltransferase n=1 Tax=Halosimplex aquaticum TaxID=3026162 RepID=A0ABD5Y0H7_9EURY|nr:GNAT family protein [Halosimplex aquaticum]